MKILALVGIIVIVAAIIVPVCVCIAFVLKDTEHGED